MEVTEQIKQLEADLVELGALLGKAERKRAQDLLKQEKQKVEKELALKKQQKEQQLKRDADPSAPSKAPYTVKITNYAWDQSDKFVKIYLTLKDVHKNPSENVEVNFKEGSFSVLVKDLNGKNHQMSILNLLHPIDPNDSFKKIKSDMVLLMCKKQTNKKWDCLTKVEQRAKEKKENLSGDDAGDSSEPLMNMLKKMYAEGDDEMKRMLNKAWTESQEKKMKGGDMMDL